MKFCIHCRSLLDIEMFGKDSSTPDGLRRWCKECTNESGKAKYVPHETYNRHLKKRYGITAAQHATIKKFQNDKYPICGGAPERLVVDHDHETEAVRGLPCRHCNFMLGNAKESPEILRKAADYLEHRSKYPLMIDWRTAQRLIRELNGAS
jgi:hypothetical protein